MRLAKSLGCQISINTDAHAEDELDYLHDGLLQLRRAWLTPDDVVNTAPTPEAFLARLRPRP
jgi:DNA polymerase (family 10)